MDIPGMLSPKSRRNQQAALERLVWPAVGARRSGFNPGIWKPRKASWRRCQPKPIRVSWRGWRQGVGRIWPRSELWVGGSEALGAFPV